MADAFASGALFKNTRPKGPPYEGSIDVPADQIPLLIEYLQKTETTSGYKGQQIVKLGLAAWVKESSKGGKFFSLSMAEPWNARKAKAEPEEDSDAPF